MKLPTARFALPTRTLAVLVVGMALGSFSRVAHSQQVAPPDDNGALGTDNQPATAPDDAAPPAQTQAGDANYGAAAGAGAVATGQGQNQGQARALARKAAMEGRMRDLMTRNGITTATTQDAILTFMREDEDNKRSVRDAGRKLWNGVRLDAPAERLRALLSEYQNALRNEHDGRVRAQTALDARVGYSLDPRLEAVLWLLGVLGEGQYNLVMPSQPPLLRGPRIAVAVGAGQGGAAANGAAVGGVMAFAVGRQIQGTVNAKNAPGEALIWLEIRDAGGHLWRVTPPNDPAARPILSRQIEGLVVGARVLVRIAPTDKADADAPLPLLAIVPVTDDGANGNDTNAGGADALPDGH